MIQKIKQPGFRTKVQTKQNLIEKIEENQMRNQVWTKLSLEPKRQYLYKVFKKRVEISKEKIDYKAIIEKGWFLH